MTAGGANTEHPHKDREAAKIGMWLFLFTEMLLFGGLFILYSAYRARYAGDFHRGGQQLDWVIGVVNTLILLTSSLTMATSLTALAQRQRRRSCWGPPFWRTRLLNGAPRSTTASTRVRLSFWRGRRGRSSSSAYTSR
jgi:heme/copper-type cytochrome/quinol oxidase subunit 3